jgi:D-beta-D-heptose 7-phosphate kinase/D-beta-D-heptose 1-phosphate adenosyltransferase
MQKTSFNVLVIGDSCVDEYRFGSVRRQNPEAPVPLFTNTQSDSRFGMAINVANNLQIFGLDVSTHAPQPESRKIRYIDERSQRQMFRVDHDVRAEPYAIKRAYPFDAIVVSDYNKGFVVDGLVEQLSQIFDGPIFVDTKKTTLINAHNVFYKVNSVEFERLQNTVPNLIVTHGEKGCTYPGEVYPGYQTKVVDVCGAGDVFLAALTVGFLRYKSMSAALHLANRCAAMSCQYLGSYTLTSEDVKCVF